MKQIWRDFKWIGRFIYKRIFLKLLQNIYHALALLVLFALALVSRYRAQKRFDIGLGPDPLLNNVHHKKALMKFGYTAETFVRSVFHITSDFDVRADLDLAGKPFARYLTGYYLFALALWRYRCLYIYFNGGPLYMTPLWRLEPTLLKLARLKTVVMPYGADIQDMTRSGNYLFKNNMCLDYPGQRLRRQVIAERIDLWTQNADFVIGGLEWVDYMYHWDELMLAHFSIDTELWKPSGHCVTDITKPLRILHAPNHRNQKGTKHFLKAIQELIAEGENLELVLLERVPNDKIKEAIESVDVVADQLIIGWYALFAIEAMALGKPVLCYMRSDLKEMFEEAGLIAKDEMPIIECRFDTVKQTIKDLLSERESLISLGQRSRDYVIKHHSLEVIGSNFDAINRKIGVFPGSISQ